jgi:hypothetical protein
MDRNNLSTSVYIFYNLIVVDSILLEEYNEIKLQNKKDVAKLRKINRSKEIKTNESRNSTNNTRF